MMKKLLGPMVAVAMTFGLADTSWATLYQLNDPVGAGSVTGTIGTDGHTGTLASGDILSWDLVLFDGSNTFELTVGNSTFTVNSTSFSATTDGLFFDFSTSTSAYVDVIHLAGANSSYLCLQDSSGACSSHPSSFGVNVGSDPEQNSSESGKVEVATAVPEPASIALLLAGLAGLGFLRRRKTAPPAA